MRKSILLCLVVLLNSCVKTDIIYGDSFVVTRTISLPRFEGVLSVDFPIEIVVQQGSPAVSITVDRDLQKYFTVDTTGGNISIHRDSKYKLVSSEQTVKVILPYLSRVILTDATVVDTIHPTTIQSIQLDGNSKFSCRVDGPGLSIGTNGTSECHIIGGIHSLKIDHASSSVLDLKNVPVFQAEVKNYSPSSVILSVSSEVRGAIIGAGNIELNTLPSLVDIDRKGTGMVIVPLK